VSNVARPRARGAQEPAAASPMTRAGAPAGAAPTAPAGAT